MPEWTEEKIEQLRKLWDADEDSTSEIGRKLGGFTKRAIIGKAHRLKLKNKKYDGTDATKPKKRPRARARKSNFGFQSGGSDEIAPPTRPPADDPTEVPVEQRRTFATIEINECHWPYGDPGNSDFFYCGARTDMDSRYCPGHRKTGRQLSSPRKLPEHYDGYGRSPSRR